MENPGGWYSICEIPSVVGVHVWIFSGTTQSKKCTVYMQQIEKFVFGEGHSVVKFGPGEDI